MFGSVLPRLKPQCVMDVQSLRRRATMLPMHIILNGETLTLDAAQTIAELLVARGLAGRRVAVEVNGEIVPRGRHDEHRLAEGDRVEIVHALGGG